MRKLDNILVILDPQQEEQPALHRAAYIARATGANLHLFMCAYDTAIGIATFLTGPQKSTIVQTIVDGSKVQVNRLAEPFREEGITVTEEVVWDRHPIDVILSVCEERDFDLIMKHAKHQSRADVMFNHIDWNLMRYSPCPVMLVKDGLWDDVGQVVAAVDAAPENELQQQLNTAVLDRSRFLADALDFELHIVSAFPSPPVFAPVSTAVQHQVNYRDRMSQLVETNLTKMADQYGVIMEHVHAVEGPVDWVIPKIANQLVAEFVVLGNVSRESKAGRSIGSTAESTLDALNTNVLMVRIFDAPG